VVAPDDGFVQELRQELLAEGTGPAAGGGAAPDPPWPTVGPAVGPGGAGRALRSVRRAPADVRAAAARRPWVATGVAAAGIVAVLALQALGDPVPPSTCGGLPCPAPTTAGAGTAVGGGLGTPLTTVRETTTTGATAPRGLVPQPPARPAAATTPPPTRPAPTAPQTTRPRPTTTRAPTTPAPTAAPTTTTTTLPTTTT
jgi:hypothetical protein